MRATWIAAGIVVAVNVLAIVPAKRERATPVGRVTIAACGDHVVGELPMLDLPLAETPGGLGGIADGGTLLGVGFSAREVASVGDTVMPKGVWPPPRHAWLVLRQEGDSLHRFRVVRVSADRPIGGADELVVRGLIGFQFVRRQPPVQTDSVGLPSRPVGIVVGVVRLLPPELGLDRAQALALKALQADSGAACTRTLPVTIASGPRGGIWVEGVGPVR